MEHSLGHLQWNLDVSERWDDGSTTLYADDPRGPLKVTDVGVRAPRLSDRIGSLMAAVVTNTERRARHSRRTDHTLEAPLVVGLRDDLKVDDQVKGSWMQDPLRHDQRGSWNRRDLDDCLNYRFRSSDLRSRGGHCHGFLDTHRHRHRHSRDGVLRALYSLATARENQRAGRKNQSSETNAHR